MTQLPRLAAPAALALLPLAVVRDVRFAVLVLRVVMLTSCLHAWVPADQSTVGGLLQFSGSNFVPSRRRIARRSYASASM